MCVGECFGTERQILYELPYYGTKMKAICFCYIQLLIIFIMFQKCKFVIKENFTAYETNQSDLTAIQEIKKHSKVLEDLGTLKSKRLFVLELQMNSSRARPGT